VDHCAKRSLPDVWHFSRPDGQREGNRMNRLSAVLLAGLGILHQHRFGIEDPGS
jgi:hypothetical protein